MPNRVMQRQVHPPLDRLAQEGIAFTNNRPDPKAPKAPYRQSADHAEQPDGDGRIDILLIP